MRFLLDTHVLLWWLEDNPRLGQRARAIIADSANDILVSHVSIWETAIKQRIGKLHIGPSEIFPHLPEFGFAQLPLLESHLMALASIGRFHGDPFDHLLLAQAQVERAAIISADRILQSYGIPCIPA